MKPFPYSAARARRAASVLATLSLAVLLADGAGAQETGGVAPPQGQKGTVVKGKAPVAKDVLQVDLPRPEEFTLPNGVRVFVLEDHRLPTVNFTLSVRGGSLFDAKPGVADLTASMLDEGTASKTSRQFAQEVERIGGSVSASAGSELALVSAGGLSEYTDQLIALMADALLRPSFPQDRLDLVKKQTAQGLVQQRADAGFLARERAAKVLYGDTPYAIISPSPDEVAAVTRQDLVAFHDRYYRPNGAILGIVGDVDPRAVVEKFKAALTDWKPAEKEAERPAAEFAPRDTTRVYLIDRPNSTQTVLSFANLAIDRRSPDYVPLVVTNRILGGGSTGRLFQNLREIKGYTYGAYSSLSTPKWLGSWGGSASVRTPVTEPAVAEFLAEFKRLQSEPVSPAELEQAQRSIVGSFARTLESPAGILARTLELVQNDLPLDYWDTYPAQVQAVTAADVQRVAKKYLGDNRIQIIAVGERDKIEAGLRKFGPVEVYDYTGKPVPAATSGGKG